MPSEPLRIFDPRRNFQLQGFTGRGATTTIHDASATGVSVSGIFQAAEDFAVLGFYNAFDYFNHLRQKHLPRTDLSGLTWSSISITTTRSTARCGWTPPSTRPSPGTP